MDWEQAGLKLVHEISTYLRKRIGQADYTSIYKLQAERSPIYAIDKEVEDLAREFVVREQMPVVLKTEDSSTQEITSKPQKAFLLDPLDGSVNAVRGIPFYCVSLAIGNLSLIKRLSLEEIDVGIVQNVCSMDTFMATKHKGSHLNGNLIRPSQVSELSQAVIAAHIRLSPPSFLTLVNSALSIRSNGSSALELCEVARGTYDAFIDIRDRLKLVDIAAGAFIIQEAGGIVTVIQNISTDDVQRDQVSIVACNNVQLHRSIIQILSKKQL